MQVYVLTHCEYDSSSIEVLRVYTCKEMAEDDMHLLDNFWINGKILIHELTLRTDNASVAKLVDARDLKSLD